MGFLKEFKHYRRFFADEQWDQRPIVFYSGNRFYSQHFEPIIKRIIEQSDLHIDFITSDPLDPVHNQESPQISVYLGNYFLAPMISRLKAKALIMTMPDLGTYHIKRASDPNVNHMYIFHAPASTTMMYRKGAFDNYDTIFCPGPYHKKEIRKTEEIYNLPQKQLVEAGYYLLEKRFHEFQNYLPVQPNHPRMVLIAPSWHDQNLVEVCGEDLFRTLLAAGYKVVYRPHPQTLISKHRKKRVEAIINPFLSLDNFIFEANPLADESFYLSDVLISDWSSITFEYAWGTERPVIFVNTPQKIYNPEYEKIGLTPLEVRLRDKIGVIVQPENVNTIPQHIEHLIDNKDFYRDSLIENRKQHLYNFGHSVEAIAEYIIQYCLEH